MLLLVGLGNPGSNYTNTRHNIGFKIIDAINAHFKLSKQKPKFKGLLTTGNIDEKKIYAIKPLTFMNNSGTAIKELIDYFKIDAKNVFVFHDDMDIDFGKIKAKFGGSSAGWAGWCINLDEWDFEKWPIKKKDLDLYLDDACKYLDIKNNFFRKKFSFWWMTQIVEKNNWGKSPLINDILKIFALEKILSNTETNRIEVYTKNKSLIKSLKVWCLEKKITLKVHSIVPHIQKLSIKQLVHHALPNIIKATAWLFYYIIKNRKLIGNELKNWKNSDADVTFVSYLFNTEPNYSKNALSFQSPYWTELPSMLIDKGVKSNWLHIFIEDKIINNSIDAASSITNFNQTASGKQFHVSLSSFLSWSVAFRSVNDWIKIISKGISLGTRVKKLEHTKLYWSLIENDWKNSLYGIAAIKNILFFNLFEEALACLDSQRICVYLMENQGWEMGLLQAWKSNGHGTIVGFPHTTIRFWDLAYFSSYNDAKSNRHISKPFPDFIACNGDAALHILRDNGLETNKLINEFITTCKL